MGFFLYNISVVEINYLHKNVVESKMYFSPDTYDKNGYLIIFQGVLYIFNV